MEIIIPLDKDNWLEVKGPQDNLGRYTSDALSWWHPAAWPLGNTPLEPGDLCVAFFGPGFSFLPEGKNWWDPGHETHFTLPGIREHNIEPSIQCGICGYHIYVEFLNPAGPVHEC